MSESITNDELAGKWYDEHQDLVSGRIEEWEEWLSRTTDLDELACALHWSSGMTLSAVYDGESEYWCARIEAHRVKLTAERIVELLNTRGTVI